MKRLIIFFLGSLGVALAAITCSSSSSSTSSSRQGPSEAEAPVPRSSPSPAATPAVSPTPTPPAVAQTNPNIVEETSSYTIERFPKKDYIRVDDKHFRHPLIMFPAKIYKEDEEYYYVYSQKLIPGDPVWNPELQAQSGAYRTPGRQTPSGPPPTPTPPGGILADPADFSDLSPARVPATFRLEEVPDSGLPKSGMWRSSFVVSDINKDGLLDVVAPPARLGGDIKPQIYIGNGKGHFERWPTSYTEEGKPRPDFSLDYGGVAVGDIDRDGNLDFATASHNSGLTALFGNGKGEFEIIRRGLPRRDFSTQAVVLLDANGDGNLDIVASRDVPDEAAHTGTYDKNQVRLYLYRPGRSFEHRADSVDGGAYSNVLSRWDYDGDGRDDLLTASHYFSAQILLWKNGGKGVFSPVAIAQVEPYSFHFATAPGTHGKEKSPAFANTYGRFGNRPEVVRAGGINVYALKKGVWSKRTIWRKKETFNYLHTVAMGDLNGDGLDDVVFPDNEANRLRIFVQQRDGTFGETAEESEPVLDSPGQCVRLADIDRNGRLDVVLSKTIASERPKDPGGFNLYLNRPVNH